MTGRLSCRFRLPCVPALALLAALVVAAPAGVAPLGGEAAAQQGGGQGQQAGGPQQQQQQTPGGQGPDTEPPDRRDPPPDPDPDRVGADPEILIIFVPDSPQAAPDTIAAVFAIPLQETFRLATLDRRVGRYTVTDGRDVEALLTILRQDPRVEAAQRNHAYGLAQSSDAAAAPQYAAAKLRLAEAHRIASGAGVTIAIIDGGLDPSHPVYAGAVDETLDVTGRAAGSLEHATALAGIIAGQGALTGVAPDARIVAIRAFWASPGAPGGIAGSSATIAKGVDRAMTADARIMNLSITGPRDELVARLIRHAARQGAIVFAAAGNGGAGAPPAYPAAYDEVVAVTAVDASDRQYRNAQRGRYIAVSAPGVDLLVAAPGGAFAIDSGTSFAAAHASGVAALLLERDPGLTHRQLRGILMTAARDLGDAGPDPDYGAGRIDAAAALATLRGTGR